MSFVSRAVQRLCIALHATTWQDQGTVTPPPHVVSNTLYSNAYRKAQYLGYDLKDTQERARTAVQQWMETGKIAAELVGRFNKPKSK